MGSSINDVTRFWTTFDPTSPLFLYHNKLQKYTTQKMLIKYWWNWPLTTWSVTITYLSETEKHIIKKEKKNIFIFFSKFFLETNHEIRWVLLSISIKIISEFHFDKRIYWIDSSRLLNLPQLHLHRWGLEFFEVIKRSGHWLLQILFTPSHTILLCLS